eukprot:35733-Eustigmatos_ZCMA.PRE.1
MTKHTQPSSSVAQTDDVSSVSSSAILSLTCSSGCSLSRRPIDLLTHAHVRSMAFCCRERRRRTVLSWTIRAGSSVWSCRPRSQTCARRGTTRVTRSAEMHLGRVG